MGQQERKSKTADANRDPISGEPGAHPVGVGLGAAGTGAAAGALGGMVGGPVGAAVGAVAGAVAGGFAGKAVAESIDPTVEDTYWRQHYSTRPYYQAGNTYDEYRPAYRYGWESRSHYADRSFEDVEPELERGWAGVRSGSKLDWARARSATRDAWDRIDEARACDNESGMRRS
jgi:hypothetical protein